MKIDVAFLPHLLTHAPSKVCIVVDVLRATSSIVTMLDRGASEIVVCASIEEARRIAADEPGRYLLCGEVESLPPPGFDCGNSPSEFSRMDLRGRAVLLATSNGTAALTSAAEGAAVLVGSLLNLSAVAGAARERARRGGYDISAVCAGTDCGRRFSLEDRFCAGALVEELAGRCPEQPHLSDDAVAAVRLYRSYRRSAVAALRQAEHGQALVGAGLGEDVAFCARVNVSSLAPALSRNERGRLVVRP